MKLRLSLFSLSAMLLIAAAISGCSSSTSPGTTDDRSKVTSSSTDTYLDVTGLSDGQIYEFTVTGSSSTTVLKGFSSYTNGIIRVFWTRGSGDNGSDTVYYRKAPASTASSGYYLWATADRTDGPNADKSWRLYETADLAAGHPSGLILGPNTTTASIAGPDSLKIDLVLATLPASALPFPSISLQSADAQYSNIPTGKMTDFSSNSVAVMGGLEMNYIQTDVSGLIPTDAANRVNVFDIKAPPDLPSDGSSMILYVRTGDNHYARVEIVPQTSSGTIVFWGDALSGGVSRRYIDVKVTYQPTTSLGYVTRPGEVRRGTNTPRHGGGEIFYQK